MHLLLRLTVLHEKKTYDILVKQLGEDDSRTRDSENWMKTFKVREAQVYFLTVLKGLKHRLAAGNASLLETDRPMAERRLLPFSPPLLVGSKTHCSSQLYRWEMSKAAGYKLLEIIQQKPTVAHNSTDGKCLAEVNGNIEFKEVTFSYPSRPDVIIFRNFSIFFPAGKTVAVVSGSGSGKSTVVSLIERFYNPNQGE
ncbi:putative ABC transporter, P-loop containing nucleoside triphosphate hydrolase [Helianthus annuus]|nr:putative ABC transporter, P-loop containing nucleoside triphosphate hydrolase [Helianthus annuus]